ncbi:dihydrofolate reductase family protein [Spirulina subsalsa]|uniref:dihydrofolate reductase family protein n=1 Tax=Spirulina subsalsa TaxID=54311 RepID=UPI000300A330|nr:dihydrofolate reductase family protein [Spirulina subsalsa]
MKITSYIATSLDGFIARTNGDLDWLNDPDYSSTSSDGTEIEDYGYQMFMNSVDVMVMGRNTYEVVLSFDFWPYGHKKIVVLSHQSIAIPPVLAQTVSSLCANPRDVVQQLEKQGFQHLYVDGGQTVQHFLREGLLQNLIITRVPILLGEGIPLFGSLSRDIRLKHGETKYFANGFVQSHYHILGDELMS